jgi:hypothetical protein
MHRRRTSWGAAARAALLDGLWLGAFGLGCDAGPDDAAGKPTTALLLGRLSDARAFTPYAPGEVLEIHHGPQGGHHVWMDGVLEGDVLGEACLVTLQMRRADDDSEVAIIQHLRVPDPKPDAEGRETLEELIIFVPDPDAVDGAEVIVAAELALDDGATLQGDEVLVRLHSAQE